MSRRGLGDAEDPFARRERAAESFLPDKPPPDEDEEAHSGDQAKPVETKPSKADSNIASKTASVGAGESKEDTTMPTATATTAEGQPSPPPAREPIGRVQFNQRIKVDRRKVLDRYRRQHGSSWQAVFDQMVDEYLERRGLLSAAEETK